MWDTSEYGFLTQLTLDENGESADSLTYQYDLQPMDVTFQKSQHPTKNSKSSTMLDDQSDRQSLHFGTHDSMDIQYDNQDEIIQLVQRKLNITQVDEQTQEVVPSYSRPVLKIQTSVKCGSLFSMSHRNVLLNMSTQVKNYYKKYCRKQQEKQLFWSIFGQRTEYKGLDWFNKLFSAGIDHSCNEFFDKYAIPMIVNSSGSLESKTAMLNFLEILRKGLKDGFIHALSV